MQREGRCLSTESHSVHRAPTTLLTWSLASGKLFGLTGQNPNSLCSCRTRGWLPAGCWAEGHRVSVQGHFGDPQFLPHPHLQPPALPKTKLCPRLMNISQAHPRGHGTETAPRKLKVTAGLGRYVPCLTVGVIRPWCPHIRLQLFQGPPVPHCPGVRLTLNVSPRRLLSPRKGGHLVPEPLLNRLGPQKDPQSRLPKSRKGPQTGLSLTYTAQP